MSERDPRAEPVPGDVLAEPGNLARNNLWRVRSVANGFVVLDPIEAVAETLENFRRWAAGATVVRQGE